jgi:hypothetical protein
LGIVGDPLSYSKSSSPIRKCISVRMTRSERVDGAPRHDVQVGNDGFGAEPQDGGEEMHQRDTTTKMLYSIGCKVIFRIGQPSRYYS